MKNYRSRMIALAVAMLMIISNCLQISAESAGNSSENVIVSRENIATPTDFYEDFEYYSMPDGSVGIFDYTGIDANVVIPSSINGCAVSEIGKEAFLGNQDIESIEMPDTVTKICNNAFGSCENIISIDMSSRVTSIGKWAFSSCESLVDIEIPEEVTSIGDYAFCDCESLTSIKIKKGVTSIGKGAFEDCINLKSIDVIENNETFSSIDGVLFNKECTELIKYPEGKSGYNYSVPKGVTSIGDSAFYGCEGLTGIEIPRSVTNIDEDAFIDCCEALVLKGYKGSYVQTYALENDISFEIIGSSSPTKVPSKKPDINKPTKKPKKTKVKEPAKPQIKSIKNTAKKIVKITLAKKVKDATSLQVQIAKTKSFKGLKTIKIKKAATVFKVKHSIIKKKAKLYFRVQGVNGKKTKGKYSVAKMCKIKK